MTDFVPNPNARRERLLRRAQELYEAVERLNEDLKEEEGQMFADAAQAELGALCSRLDRGSE